MYTHYLEKVGKQQKWKHSWLIGVSFCFKHEAIVLGAARAGRPKFNRLQTQFGEDRCTQFRVIVTDQQTNRQGRL